MKNRILRIALVTLVAIVLAAIVTAVGVVVRSNSVLSRTHPLPPPFAATAGDAVRGEHVVRTVAACQVCHGEDLGGRLMIDSGAFMKLPAPNLTSGRGGLGASLQPADWERAVRHGLDPRGRALLMMPSADYASLSDEDVAGAIAYLRGLAPVDRDPGALKLGPAGRMALAFAPEGLLAALRQDQSKAAPATTPVGEAVVRGQYLALTCRGCHGQDLAGAAQGVEPGTPPPPDLTPHPQSPIAAWTEADFTTLLRTGKRPDGRAVNEVMPWRAFATFTDDEVAALWAYLRSVPPRPPTPTR